MFEKIFKTAKQKKIAAAIMLPILAGGGYLGYNSITSTDEAIRYVLATTEKGTIITSVGGSGQVSATNQIDVKPKVSGNVISVNIKNGQEVKEGAILVQLDTREAREAVNDASANLSAAKVALDKLKNPDINDLERAVSDAEINLESAKLSLKKMQEPADELSVMQAENTLKKAGESKSEAEDDLKKAYEDGFNNVANVFLTLPSLMSGLDDILHGHNSSLGGSGQENIDFYYDAAGFYDGGRAFQYKTDVATKYSLARDTYEKNFDDYKATSRYADTVTIEALITETYDTTKNIAETIKSAINLVQFYEDQLISHNVKPAIIADTHLSSLASYTGKTSSYLLDLLFITRSIENSKTAIVNAERSIEEKTEALNKLLEGDVDELDIKSQELTIKQREKSLQDAKNKLAENSVPDKLDIQSQEITIRQRQNALYNASEALKDYFVRAPFSGVIAASDIKKGDAISGSTVVATLITKQKIAEISLNEVDVAKVKVGQKATLTFDAAEGLSITGSVVEIDIVGTVSQGVVTYNIKINFDAEDERIKPGMSVSASIVTDIKQDILTVPNSAIKTQGETSYVEILDQPGAETAGVQGVTSLTLPEQQQIEVGLSNDTLTEIISGLAEDEKVIIRTITPGNATTINSSNQKTPSLFGGGTGGGIMKTSR